MTSLASENGPSVTVGLPPALFWTRKPLSPKLTPSVWISQPSFIASSMSLPIAAISACVGARLTGSCVKMLMNLMMSTLRGFVVVHPYVERPAGRSTRYLGFFSDGLHVGAGRQLAPAASMSILDLLMDPRKAKKTAPPPTGEYWGLDPQEVRLHARRMREARAVGPLGKIFRVVVVGLVLMGAFAVWWNFDTLRDVRFDVSRVTSAFGDA